MQHLFSRDDAVKMLHKKLEGQPYIEGTVIGSHQIYTEFGKCFRIIFSSNIQFRKSISNSLLNKYCIS